MPANVTQVSGATQTEWYLGNYTYTEIAASMNALQLKLDTAGTNSLFYKNAAGTLFKIMRDSSAGSDIPENSILIADSDGAVDYSSTFIYNGTSLYLGIASGDGLVHFHEGSAGTTTADSGANTLVLENSSHAGLSILSPDANYSTIALGSPSDNIGSFIRWKYADLLMDIGGTVTNSELALYSNGSEAVRINSDGNVGIGKDTLEAWGSSYTVLQLGGNTSFMTNTTEGDTPRLQIMNNVYLDGTDYKRVSTDETSQIRMVSGNIIFYNDQSGTADAIFTPTETMRFTGSGKVGFGITSPDGLVHIHTATAGTVTADSGADELVLENSTDGGMSILVPDNSDANIILGTPSNNTAARIEWDYSQLQLCINTNIANGNIVFRSSTEVECGRFDENGFLGLNSSNPSTRLHVREATGGGSSVSSGEDLVVIENDVNTYINILTTADDKGGIVFSDTARAQGGLIYNHSANYLQFLTVGQERMRINVSGYVGIGENDPDEILHIKTGSPTIQLENTSDNLSCHIENSSGTFILSADIDNTVADTNILLKIDTAVVMSIDVDGNIGMGKYNDTPTAALDVDGDIFRLQDSKTPTSASATGNVGSICWDTNYIYVCTATDTWKRVAISTW